VTNKYEFSYDPVSGILLVNLSGYLLPDEIPTYLAQRLQNREEARRKAGQLRMLVDATEAPVQSADTVASVQRDWEDAVRSPHDRIAIVPSSALHAMQARRTIQSDQVRIFMSAEEARQWLITP
jgi:hypothetical protein